MSGCGVRRTSQSLIRSPGRSSAGRTPLLRYTHVWRFGYLSNSCGMPVSHEATSQSHRMSMSTDHWVCGFLYTVGGCVLP